MDLETGNVVFGRLVKAGATPRHQTSVVKETGEQISDVSLFAVDFSVETLAVLDDAAEEFGLEVTRLGSRIELF